MNDRAFAWSYSQLKNYETCPKRYYHYQVAKDVAEPESPQLKSGHELHAAFEARLKARTTLPLDLSCYEPIMASLERAPGDLRVEQKLAITSSFTPTPFFSDRAWFRTATQRIR